MRGKNLIILLSVFVILSVLLYLVLFFSGLNSLGPNILCTGYAFGPNDMNLPSEKPSPIATFYALSLNDGKINNLDRMRINCYIDKLFYFSGCDKAYQVTECTPYTCSGILIYTFAEIKNKLGFKLDDIIKDYNLNKSYETWTELFMNTNYPMEGCFAGMSYDHYMGSLSFHIFLFNKRIDEITNSNNTEIIINDNRIKTLLIKLINYIPDQSPVEPYIPYVTRLSMVSAFKSSNFSHVSDLKTLPEANTTKLEYFCNLSELKFPQNICDASSFVIVKDFCEEKLTENETIFINNLLSQDYTYLNHRYCKAYFGKTIPTVSATIRTSWKIPEDAFPNSESLPPI